MNWPLHLRELPGRPPLPMSLGDKGWWVGALRRLLTFHGELGLPESAPASQEFGHSLRGIIMELQPTLGQKPDGVVDAELFAKLVCPGHTAGDLALQAGLIEAYRGAKEQGGNNKGPDCRKYAEGTDKYGLAWCALFATWCHISTRKNGSLWFANCNRASSSALFKEGNKKKRVRDNPMDAVAGDLALVRGGSTGHKHTALVSHVANGYVYVVEGNVRPRKWIPWQYDVVRLGKYPLKAVDIVRGA